MRSVNPNELLSEYFTAAADWKDRLSNVHVMNNTAASALREGAQSKRAEQFELPFTTSVSTGPQVGYERNAEPPPLFNAREPAYLLQAERPIHRAIVWLAAQGLSYIEIAERLGVSPPMVHYVVKQPWAETAILEAIHQNGGDAVAAVLQAEALPSVKKLIELRDDADAPREVQRKSANDLLDRLFGKCAQPIVHRQEDLEELSDKELQELVNRGRAN